MTRMRLHVIQYSADADVAEAFAYWREAGQDVPTEDELRAAVLAAGRRAVRAMGYEYATPDASEVYAPEGEPFDPEAVVAAIREEVAEAIERAGEVAQ